MNLVLFTADERHNDTVVLSGRRAEHIRRILRLASGDRLRVGEVNGLTGTAVISHIDGESLHLSVTLSSPPPQSPDIELILALPRPIMLQRILKQATTLGVRRFHLIRTRRVEKSFFHTPVLFPEKIEKILLEGMEQAMDTRMPEVCVYRRFKPFVADILPTLGGKGLLAHPTAESPLNAFFTSSPAGKENTKLQTGKGAENEKILLAVGPEGGFVDYECRQFIEHGFYPFTMGPRILHVDTAVVALLAQIMLLRQ
ncbi:MAG TPA: 16S rRNA (uracil(1498)-N(3))-methyltransferase [Desulfobulbus sp.]|nr:16S rRNA (uracil(1498)-N(3))-methyltransferase [Desulfobulbus sp.]